MKLELLLAAMREPRASRETVPLILIQLLEPATFSKLPDHARETVRSKSRVELDKFAEWRMDNYHAQAPRYCATMERLEYVLGMHDGEKKE